MAAGTLGTEDNWLVRNSCPIKMAELPQHIRYDRIHPPARPNPPSYKSSIGPGPSKDGQIAADRIDSISTIDFWNPFTHRANYVDCEQSRHNNAGYFGTSQSYAWATNAFGGGSGHGTTYEMLDYVLAND